MINNISQEEIEKIIKVMKEGKLSLTEIMNMFSITRYYLYKIMKEHDIKQPDVKTGPKKSNFLRKISQEDILKIVSVMKEGKLTSGDIFRIFHITKYYLNKIIKEYNVKPAMFKMGPKGPKKTKFKLLIEGTEEEQKQANIFPSEFVLNDFIVDCKKGMKILELMPKYNLTLYQIRELRKKYDLKHR